MKCCCFTTSTSASRELTGGNSSCDLDSDLETSRGSGGTSIAGHRPNWKAIGGCLPLRRLTFIKSLRMPTPSSAGGGMGHERRELVLRIILRPRIRGSRERPNQLECIGPQGGDGAMRKALTISTWRHGRLVLQRNVRSAILEGCDGAPHRRASRTIPGRAPAPPRA